MAPKYEGFELTKYVALSGVSENRSPFLAKNSKPTKAFDNACSPRSDAPVAFASSEAVLGPASSASNTPNSAAVPIIMAGAQAKGDCTSPPRGTLGVFRQC